MRKFEILDVFAQRAYEGNQLAVFTDSRGLTADEMQHMAAEMHYSETSFIDPDKTDGAYRVRIFTPAHEVPFAGHPTLGTADVIRRRFEGGKADEILLDMQVGRIPVTVGREGERDVYRMRQVEPEFRSQLPASRLAPVLGLDEADFDSAFPIEEVSQRVEVAFVLRVRRREDVGLLEDLDAEALDIVSVDLVHASLVEDVGDTGQEVGTVLQDPPDPDLGREGLLSGLGEEDDVPLGDDPVASEGRDREEIGDHPCEIVSSSR